MPISRILETTGIGFDSFYRKLNFIHVQRQPFAGHRENRLLAGRFNLPKMYLSTDRQAYIVNWVGRKDRRTVQMNAIGTADQRTGYVFGMALNFDDQLHKETVEADAIAVGDIGLSPPHRKYARVFGMGIHEQYTMYGHFVLLAKLLKTAPKVRLFMDQDSGFRAAAISAFGPMIKARTADAFFVKVDKAANAYEKTNAVAAARASVLAFMVAEKIPDEGTAIVEMMKLEIKKSVSMTRWQDRWVRHVRPIAAEPSKYVCWLTKYAADDDEEDAENHHARSVWPKLQSTLTPFCTSPSVTRQLDSRSSLA